MSYRKFQASKIFNGTAFLDSQQVLITANDGSIEAMVDVADAGDDIQHVEGILSPGFINCHCHLELSHMKGRIPERTGLVDFVAKVVTERHHAQSEILEAIADAESAMLDNGIVAVGDICNNAYTLPQKLQQRMAYYNFIEASGWLPSVSAARFDRAKALFEQFQQVITAHPLNDVSIVPHAPYSVSNALWNAIKPYFDDKTVSIHNQETAFEDEFFLQGTGDFGRMYTMMNIDNSHHQPPRKTSLQSYYHRMSKAGNIILVHNTFTGEADIRYIKSTSSWAHTFFCICINANQYIEHSVPPVEMFRRHACNIVVGTDSLASNHQLDIAHEIGTIRKHFPSIPLAEILSWATMNGAIALNMQESLGSFEKGKRPGIIVFDEANNTAKRIV